MSGAIWSGGDIVLENEIPGRFPGTLEHQHAFTKCGIDLITTRTIRSDMETV